MTRQDSLPVDQDTARQQPPPEQGGPRKLKKVVTFESTHEIIQYETQTPEMSSASESFDRLNQYRYGDDEDEDDDDDDDDDEDDSVNVPVIDPYAMIHEDEDHQLSPVSQRSVSRPLPQLPSNISPEFPNSNFYSPEAPSPSPNLNSSAPGPQLSTPQISTIASPEVEDQFEDTLSYRPDASPAFSMTSDEDDMAQFGPDGKLSAGAKLARKESLLESQRKVATEYVASVPYAAEPSAAQVQRSLSQRRRSLNVALDQAAHPPTTSIKEEPEEPEYQVKSETENIAVKSESVEALPIKAEAQDKFSSENQLKQEKIKEEEEKLNSKYDRILQDDSSVLLNDARDANHLEKSLFDRVSASPEAQLHNDNLSDIPMNDVTSDEDATTDQVRLSSSTVDDWYSVSDGGKESSPSILGDDEEHPLGNDSISKRTESCDTLNGSHAGDSTLSTPRPTHTKTPSLAPSLPEIEGFESSSPFMDIQTPVQNDQFDAASDRKPGADHVKVERIARTSQESPESSFVQSRQPTYHPGARHSFAEEGQESLSLPAVSSPGESNLLSSPKDSNDYDIHEKDSLRASKELSGSQMAETVSSSNNQSESCVDDSGYQSESHPAAKLATQPPTPSQLFNFEPAIQHSTTQLSDPVESEVTDEKVNASNTSNVDIPSPPVPHKTPALLSTDVMSPFKFSPAENEKSTFSQAPTPMIPAALAMTPSLLSSNFAQTDSSLEDERKDQSNTDHVTSRSGLDADNSITLPDLSTSSNANTSMNVDVDQTSSSVAGRTNTKPIHDSPLEPPEAMFASGDDSPDIYESPMKSEEYESFLLEMESQEREAARSKGISEGNKHDSMLDIPQISDDFLEGFDDIIEKDDITTPLADDGREMGISSPRPSKYGSLGLRKDMSPHISTMRSSSGKKSRPSLTPEDVEKFATSKGAEENDNNRHLLYELSKKPIPLPVLQLSEEESVLGGRDSLFLDDINEELDKILGGEEKKGYTVRQHEASFIATRKTSGNFPEAERRVSGPVKPILAFSERKVSSPVPGTIEEGNESVNEQETTAKEAESDVKNETPVDHSNPQQQDGVAENPMPNLEKGRLFVRIKSIKDVDLPGIPNKKAKFNLTLDNGIHCITAENRDLNALSSTLDEEFELSVIDELEFILTLKTKWQKTNKIVRRPVSQQPPPPQPKVEPKKPETTKRHGFSRLFGGKRVASNASTATTTWAQQAPVSQPKTYKEVIEPDSWDSLVAIDGSFGRAYVDFSQYEEEVYGKAATFELVCFNEWAKEPNSKQRKPPYRICTIQVEMMFIPRSSKKEVLPRSIEEATDELREAKKNAPVHLEGVLSQLGGDCKYWRRRYFVLDGASLVAHSETSKKPRAAINLTKASKVVVERSELTEPVVVTGKSRRKSAFAEREDAYGMVEEGFRLRFSNGEIIDFYADNREEKQRWLDALNKIVGNPSFHHHPWIDMVLRAQST